MMPAVAYTRRAADDLIRAGARLWLLIDQWVDRRVEGGRSPVLASSHEFLADAEIVEEAPIAVSASVTLYAVALLVLSAITWATFGFVDRIVMAEGKIATQTPLIVVQPYSTSRILKFAAKPGDHVRKGDVLVTFDPALARADQLALEHKVATLSAQIERIEAQLSEAPVFSLGASSSPERRGQAQIFAQQMAERAAELDIRATRERATGTQIAAARESVSALRQQLDNANRMAAIRRFLREQKAGSLMDVMAAQNAVLDLRMRLETAVADENKYVQQLGEIRAERQSYLDKGKAELNQQLVSARDERTDTEQTLAKARKLSDLTQIRAPADGVVLEVSERSVGSVLKEAETLLTLVPDAATLFVQTQVSSSDVGYVKKGDLVRLKLEAYPYQRYGTINGRLEVVGADSVVVKSDDPSRVVYPCRVRIVDTPQALAQRGIAMRPGLVATVEIKSGSQSVLSYLLNPVFGTFDAGLHEP